LLDLLVTFPKVPLRGSVVTPPQFGWFGKLKNSLRNWTRWLRVVHRLGVGVSEAEALAAREAAVHVDLQPVVGGTGRRLAQRDVGEA